MMNNIKLKLVFFALAFTGFIYGQINTVDSTVQTIGYWSKNETQSYVITIDKYKLNKSDTTSHDRYKFNVDIVVKDSTADSYTLEWKYKNYEIESENEILKKIMSMSEDMTVLVKTDEFGAFEEVVNWKELSAYMKNITTKLRKEYKDAPTLVKLIKQVENTYDNKAAIESNTINEIQQFFSFHGGKYALGEVYEGNTKTPNMYGTEPFDTEFTMSLDTIQFEDNNYILRYNHSINQEQLEEATYTYLKTVMKTMGLPEIQRKDIKDIANQTDLASRIHGSGWVIYSIQTKTVSTDNSTNIEETIIEII